VQQNRFVQGEKRLKVRYELIEMNEEERGQFIKFQLRAVNLFCILVCQNIGVFKGLDPPTIITILIHTNKLLNKTYKNTNM
jgi:hypothetical protein